jgi:hypothetical protein
MTSPRKPRLATRMRAVLATTIVAASMALPLPSWALYPHEGRGECSGGNDTWNDYVCLYDSATPGQGLFLRLELQRNSTWPFANAIPDLSKVPRTGDGNRNWSNVIASWSSKINHPYTFGGCPGGSPLAWYDHELVVTGWKDAGYGGSQVFRAKLAAGPRPSGDDLYPAYPSGYMATPDRDVISSLVITRQIVGNCIP